MALVLLGDPSFSIWSLQYLKARHAVGLGVQLSGQLSTLLSWGLGLIFTVGERIRKWGIRTITVHVAT